MIGFYWVCCKKDIVKNLLDEIIGIGLMCKKVLLVYFGIVKVVFKVGVEDFVVVFGILEVVVRLVYDYFYE